MVEGAKSDYEWNQEEVTRLERLTQDYLHKLELENLSYAERAKVATQLARCRQMRRASKDTVEILEAVCTRCSTGRRLRASTRISPSAPLRFTP